MIKIKISKAMNFPFPACATWRNRGGGGVTGWKVGEDVGKDQSIIISRITRHAHMIEGKLCIKIVVR